MIELSWMSHSTDYNQESLENGWSWDSYAFQGQTSTLHTRVTHLLVKTINFL